MIRRILLTALFAANAHAHDFWLEPSTFAPQQGKTFTVALRVGENFEGDPVPRRSPRIESFTVRTASGERAVGGFENQDPAGFVQFDEAGAVIGYRGKQSQHELSSAKFTQFLEEEGVRSLEPKKGMQRERYFRFAKAIVGRDTSLAEKPFGWRFELIPSGDRFQLLYDGKPLHDALVTAISREHKRLTARTDTNGFVRFDLKGGVWLIKSTHVTAAPKESGFDWESLWASLTFER